ncbi:hypothetical protein G6F37_006480 [Rhizopus arrhizus]|nr:hypothetical protein G6F38_008704 [Rhizopus arrhizus]KAG1157682.1 hypothetical protein G6F37_006480 [Rhizopus arrhizus]
MSHVDSTVQELDLLGILVERCSIQQQMDFIRNVYFITLSQFLLVSSMLALILNVQPLSNWLEESKYAWWIVLFPALLFMIIAIWQLWTHYYQLSQLTRIIILVIYSFFMSFILSELIAKVFYAYGLLVMTMVCFGILNTILYTFQTRFKFEGMKPIILSVAVICISSVGLRKAYNLDPVQILGPIALSCMICSYLNLELYYAMKNMTVEDYILANMSFHIDIIYPIHFIHHISELFDSLDHIPEYFHPGI